MPMAIDRELMALVAFVRCLSMACETSGCAALCDEDAATLITAGFAGPHGPLRGWSGLAEAGSAP